jgi:hypothetical protein
MIEMKVERKIFSVTTLKESSVKAYWLSLTPNERLLALQKNRQAAFGESNASQGLQRVLEVVKRP